MNEIKCRVWHEKLNRMISNDELCDNAVYHEFGFDWTDENGKSWELDWDGVMRYTGIKAKNGDIYGGDICTPYPQCLKMRDSFLVATWWKCGWRWSQPNLTVEIQSWIYESADRVTIIGNVHENPELLKDK